MICISINQESRRLAIFDMFNAAPQCDLMEVRLDRFGMAPELNELLANKPRPVIMSCRRKRDGGYWDGSEAERLALLRQAIVHKPDYVEIELDVADQVRRFPPAERVISYTNLKETPADIADIYAEMQTKQPDIIKLTTLARTPEEAWPLVQILAKPPVPTVVVGLGKPGVLLALLGRKIGAPWTYAALERGMEAYPDQPTVADLKTIYRYQDFGKGTRLVGVTGFGERDVATVACLNAVMAALELPARCLPMGVGSVKLFRKIIEAVKLAGVVVSDRHGESLREMADELHPAAELAHAVDVLLHKDDRLVRPLHRHAGSGAGTGGEAGGEGATRGGPAGEPHGGGGRPGQRRRGAGARVEPAGRWRHPGESRPQAGAGARPVARLPPRGAGGAVHHGP